ncbi:neurochondrin-like [Oculina patagonica]
MNENTCESCESGANDNAESSLQKCISVLKAAKSDTERFAALLLVTQLVHSNAIDVVGRRQLFEAIGFKFINRLLNTRNVPSDCPQDIYNSLALTILACFSTDEELCLHAEFLKKIPLFLVGISNSAEDSNENQASVDDCYQIIASLACSLTGCRHLVEKGAFATLCRVLSGENDGKYTTKAIEILLRILNNDPRVSWKEQKDVLFEALNALSVKFREARNNTKFELCRYLVLFLSGAEKSVFQGAEHRWLGNVYKALNDILQSKISSEQRDPAIVLTSAVIELVGMDWMIEFSENESPGLFILSLTIASVEIRMILDGKTEQEISPKAAVLTSCFNILEKAINFAVVNAGTLKNNRQLPSIVSESLPRVYTIATESIHSIVMFLEHVAHVKNKETITGQQECQVVLASVRILCAWMAEETAALQDDICKLLPFLLKLGKESLNSSTEHVLKCDITDVSHSSAVDDASSLNVNDMVDIMRFLLPPLCHLSADEKTRKILIENDGIILLSKYFFRQWKFWGENMEYSTDVDELETCLVTILNIFLNIIVTEPKLLTRDQALQEIGHHAVTSTSPLLSAEKNVVILMNLVVLGLMFIRNHAEVNSMPFDSAELSVFLKDSVHVLKEAKDLHVTPRTKDIPSERKSTQLTAKCKEAWADISELWFLGLQVFSALTSTVALARDALKASGWTETIVAFLNCSQAQELSGDEKDVLVDLVRKHSYYLS